MHIHILGICGTFMGGIACLAAERGFTVSGSDENVYPPMSTQLEKLGIKLQEGYKPEHLHDRPDLVVIGNALSRGNPAVEYVLNSGLRYQSGPQWLSELMQDRWVIAVAGTHGKTTTTSMIAWILTYAGLEPGFLIGGIPANFGISARWGRDPFFVIEADEYDCAFFDKRAKFVHYHPKTCVLNNLEFDHADIYPTLGDIKKQFHHLVRTVPGQGALVVPQADEALQDVLKMGCWSELKTFGSSQGDWQAQLKKSDGSIFTVTHQGKPIGDVQWSLIGDHNVHNALAAVAAAVHAGVPPAIAVEALAEFQSVKRRLEVRGQIDAITVYDDFAHHPTAIRTTIAGLRAKIGQQRLIAVLDIRSNTMCLGTHREELPAALQEADAVFAYQSPKVKWDVSAQLQSLKKVHVHTDTQNIIDALLPFVQANDHILIMSNGGFDNIHQRLLQALQKNEVVA